MDTALYIQLPLFVLHKCCTQCGAVKPIEHFATDRARPDGHGTWCKVCKNARREEWRRHGPKRPPRPAPTAQGKMCSHCGAVQPWSAFSLDRAAKDGHQGICRACRRVQQQQRYYADHRATLALVRARKEAHRADINDRQRARNAANPEPSRAACRRWRTLYPERMSQAAETWRAAHAAWCAAYSKQYNARRYRQNKAAFLQSARKRRLRAVLAEGHYTEADIMRLYNDQGALCAYCAVPLGTTFHRDHKIPLARGGSNWPENLCLACPRCNSRKQAKTEAAFRALLAAEREQQRQ